MKYPAETGIGKGETSIIAAHFICPFVKFESDEEYFDLVDHKGKGYMIVERAVALGFYDCNKAASVCIIIRTFTVGPYMSLTN